jgi:hypothetical protein
MSNERQRTAKTKEPLIDNPKDGAHKDGPSRDEDPTTPFGRFEKFVKNIAAVSKEELDQKRAEYEREKKRKKRAG